jgi:hypothetical protein
LIYQQTDGVNSTYQQVYSNTGTDCPVYYFRRARGVASGAVFTDGGDSLGSIIFTGYSDEPDGWIEAAKIAVFHDGTDHYSSGKLCFYTAANGAAGVTERMRINAAGRVGINVADPSSRLDVGGDLEVASDGWTYYGDPTTDGSWRVGRSGNDLVVEKRITGSWTTKHTFA